MSRRWEVHLRLEDGSTETLMKAWTLTGAKRIAARAQKDLDDHRAEFDWSAYVWDTQTKTPVVFS